MIKKKNKFLWPKKLYDITRIHEENKLVKSYGLKNKREIWKTEAKVKYFRDRAKSLINSNEEEKQNFFRKLNEIGLNVKNIADVLALNKEDLLKRRLSSVIFEKKMANTPKQARQMIVHKKVFIRGKAVNSPAYLVNVSEEGDIKLKQIKKQDLENVGKAEESKNE